MSADDLDILVNLRAYLAAEDLVSVPTETPAADAPPRMHIEPRLGVPAPGEGEEAIVDERIVLGIDLGVGLTPRPLESWLRDDQVEVTFRALVSRDTHRLEERLRAVLVDKFDWQMAGVHIIESQLGRPLALLERNSQAFTHRCSFRFQRKTS